MKKFFLITLVAITLSSCIGIHHPLTHNTNVNQTQVVLSHKNYKIIERVEGHASTASVLGIGNHGMKTLVANARADMLKKVNLIGTSRAIINEQVEVNNRRILLIVSTKTVNVSAYIIEFTE